MVGEGLRCADDAGDVVLPAPLRTALAEAALVHPGPYRRTESPGGIGFLYSGILDAEWWLQIAWNPYEEWVIDHTGPPPAVLRPTLAVVHPVDAAADPKPPWATVERWALRSALVPAMVAEARKECQRRITAAYGARDLTGEMLRRLRGADPDADAERDRLRAVCALQVAWIEDPGRTRPQLEAHRIEWE